MLPQEVWATAGRAVGRPAQVAGSARAAPLGRAVRWIRPERSPRVAHQAWPALVQPEAHRLQVARLVVLDAASAAVLKQVDVPKPGEV